MTDSLGRVNSDALASRFISEKPLDVEAWLGTQRLFILGARAERTLEDLYYEFAWLGWVASRSQVLTAQAASKSAITPFMDWQGWVPGNPEAARKLLGDRDVPGLQDLLDRAGITIRGIRDTRLKDLARILSNAQAAGTGYKQTARAIREQFTRSRKWSEMVARTEGRRAVTAASKDYYAASGLEQVRWSTAWGNACPICKAFEDLGPVPLEGGFGGLDGPPGHPNCLCVIMPVVGPFTAPVAEVVPEDVEVIPEPAVEPVEDDGYYPRDKWPEWAKSGGLGDVIGELPRDRSRIGFRRQTKQELIDDFEERHSGVRTPLRKLRDEGAKAEKQLPKKQKAADDIYNGFQNYIDSNPRLKERGITGMGHPYTWQDQVDFPEYYDWQEKLRMADNAVTDLNSDIGRWKAAEKAIADAKAADPKWFESLVPEDIVDIDAVTGAPGEVLRAQMTAVKKAGRIVEDEVQRRLPPRIRDMKEIDLSPEDLSIVRQTRQQVVSEVRPMDTGMDMFQPVDDATARRIGAKGHGPFSGADQALLDMAEPSLDYYPSAWIDRMKADNPAVRVLYAGRGYNSFGETIAISGKGERGIMTFVHEIGHSAQQSVPGLKRLEWVELFDRSVKPTGKLPGLTAIYSGEKDRMLKGHTFPGKYSGRLYTKVEEAIAYIRMETPSKYFTNYEVFTTGMQGTFPRVLLDDPKFGDASFQEFILGALVSL